MSAENVVRRFLAGKPTYTGVFLDHASHERLVSWWDEHVKVPLHAKTFAHHMTIKFRPTAEEIEALPLGEQATLHVVGWAADDKGQAVLVAPQGIESVKQHPHITMACAPGTSPVYSNDLLAHGVTHVSGPTLTGTIEAR